MRRGLVRRTTSRILRMEPGPSSFGMRRSVIQPNSKASGALSGQSRSRASRGRPRGFPVASRPGGGTPTRRAAGKRPGCAPGEPPASSPPPPRSPRERPADGGCKGDSGRPRRGMGASSSSSAGGPISPGGRWWSAALLPKTPWRGFATSPESLSRYRLPRVGLWEWVGAIPLGNGGSGRDPHTTKLLVF